MRILGIDPGKQGAWCLLDSETGEAVFGKLKWSEDYILERDQFPPFDFLILEKIKAIPGKMGVVSSFTMGVGFGQLLGFASLHQYSLVTPQRWQSICLEGIDTDLDSKLRSRIGWARVNPGQPKIDHNIADAFHIANYGMHKFGLGQRSWVWSSEISKRSKNSSFTVPIAITQPTTTLMLSDNGTSKRGLKTSDITSSSAKTGKSKRGGSSTTSARTARARTRIR